jgi:glycosyltransferase involved in cell wall biosynthesis
VRLLFVVQRYGREVAGGAELSCRQFATRLAERGHQVEALTSCAISYVDWSNVYPPGTEMLDGVLVHRLPVRRSREHRFFGSVDFRAVWQYRPSSLLLQEAWMQAQGPDLPDLADWLRARAADFDVVIFFTYLYYTAWRGLSAIDRAVPTILHATAHDEPPLWLQVFDQMLVLPTAYAYFTEEEQALITRRTHRRRTGRVVGIGTDLGVAADGQRFRIQVGLGDRPYLLYVGRVDPAKGSVELYEQFLAYKHRHEGDLTLVIVGDPVSPLDPHPDVLMAGYVDDQAKADALAGCLALVQPSYFESFSMVLVEAWAQARPAIVQGRSDVLRGQATRSGGAIPYRDFAEFEAAVDLLVEDPPLAARLGKAGRRYVVENYAWGTVLDRYEELLRAVGAIHRHPPDWTPPIRPVRALVSAE